MAIVVLFAGTSLEIHRKIATEVAEHDSGTSSTSLHPPTSRTGHGVSSNSNSNINKKKYVLYFAQSGFANQQICLKHAYVMARLLNRTLLMPPVLPHFGPGATYSTMILSKNKQRFKVRSATRETLMNPFYHYLERLPPDQYLPMHQVLDIEYSLPGVETMDVREFHETVLQHAKLTRHVLELDSDISHFNTIWTHQRPDLEGTNEVFSRNYYGAIHELNRTYRDMTTTLASRSEDILVFLDSFVVSYHESIYKAVPMWRPRLAPSIRQAVLKYKDQIMVATMGRPKQYAAIHLRAGDGSFQNPERISETIHTVWSNVTNIILQWLSSTTTSSFLPSNKVVVGLYVATDFENFHNHTEFWNQARLSQERIYQKYQTNVTIYTQASMWEEEQEAKKNATHYLSGLPYADAFWDIQMAVCAPIGFIGTKGSSFSYLIDDHRGAQQECLEQH